MLLRFKIIEYKLQRLIIFFSLDALRSNALIFSGAIKQPCNTGRNRLQVLQNETPHSCAGLLHVLTSLEHLRQIFNISQTLDSRLFLHPRTLCVLGSL